MKCPICHRPIRLTDPESPFCSERCREVDLGNWAMEKYVISTPTSRGSDPNRPDPADPESGESGWDEEAE